MKCKKSEPLNDTLPFCKLTRGKGWAEHLESYSDLVRKPKYVCGKCGRAARKKKNLCKPVSL